MYKEVKFAIVVEDDHKAPIQIAATSSWGCALLLSLDCFAYPWYLPYIPGC